MRYFDHNATHPLSRVAKDAWLDAAEKFPANPSSPHRLGSRAEAALQRAREQVAGWLGCSPFDVVWTSGATEANNAVIHHLSRQSEGSVWISAIEHPSVLAAVARWLEGRHRLIPVTAQGAVDLSWLEENLKRGRPTAIAVMAANNETGVLQPWNEALSLCRQYQVSCFCDAAQWVGKMSAAGLGSCDFVTGCAHKFGGPLGVGFMKCPPPFQPLIVGGPQEDGRRAGTENVPGIMAMVAALAEREETLAIDASAERMAWRDGFCRELASLHSGIRIVADKAPRLWNTVAALMPPASDCRQRWVVKLDKLGFAVSTGSACASGKEKPSQVLTAMGYESAESDRMLRFSAGWETTKADWEALREGVKQAIEQMAGVEEETLLRPSHQ